ncbi:hypothetical protein M9H77_12684 [Catharanthus roseus]|uniref:Uncharacterized protein n=1 Tax=Catharanthus roseus TaxID=4058 RepID=A0ACC0BI16_CATRO|nr:hypothetical protein M9H77_12684 [Catharanthus roseus]
MDPNLWNVRMTMRVPSYYEVHRMFYFNLYSMNNDEEMRYLWTIPADLLKKGIHILVEFDSIQQENIPSTHDRNTTTLPEHITAVTQMVSDEPSMLYISNDPEIPVSNIIQEVQVLFQIGCTYKRAWYARKFAIERVFGSWDTTFSILPKYLQAVQDLNPGTVYEFLHYRTSSSPNYVFKSIVWCFSLCIDGFPYCRLVISVDRTHLRTIQGRAVNCKYVGCK